MFFFAIAVKKGVFLVGLSHWEGGKGGDLFSWRSKGVTRPVMAVVQC